MESQELLFTLSMERDPIAKERLIEQAILAGVNLEELRAMLDHIENMPTRTICVQSRAKFARKPSRIQLLIRFFRRRTCL